MAKPRHLAIQVPDLEKAAAFYESVFGLKRLKKVEAPIGNAISLSDGVMNLTLLHFPTGTKGGQVGPDWAGLHHFGFVVHGIWPQFQNGTWPQNSSTKACLSDAQLMFDIIPSKMLITREWPKHATRSGLSAQDYFARTRRAFEGIRIPA